MFTTPVNSVTIGLTLLFFIVGLTLASSISFANWNVTVPYTYDTDTNVFHAIKHSASMHDIVEGSCLDLDKILAIMNSGIGLGTENMTIDCADNGADLEIQQLVAGSNSNLLIKIPDGQYENRVAPTDTLSPSVRDCAGKRWYIQQPIDDYETCILTDNHTYANIWAGGKVGETYTENIDIWIKNETYNPYLTANFTTNTYETMPVNITDSVSQVQMWTYDLGYYQGSEMSGEWQYFTNPAQLSVVGAKHQYYGFDTLTTNNNNKVACGMIADELTAGDLFDINSPITTNFKKYCFNATANTRGFKWGVLKFINNTVSPFNFDAYFSRMSSGYMSIFNVQNIPEHPTPNSTVIIYWETSDVANGTAFYRSKLAGNWTSGWTPFTKIENVSTGYTHLIHLPKENIIADYQYQYYVQSGLTVDNNSDVYYNFSVMGVTIPFQQNGTYVNGSDTVYQAITDMANNMGIEKITVTYMFSVIILIIITLAMLVITHNPIGAVAVFLIGALSFSLFGWLPWYVFYIIAILFALAMVKILGGMF